MTELIKYDAACRLLAEAAAVDEVVDILDQAAAMREYARRAKNRTLEIDAAQIRMRAERRLGEMIIEQKATVGLNRGRAGAGRPRLGCSDDEPPKPDERPTLEQAGIDRKLSSRAQRVAEIGSIRFEALLAMVRNQGDGRVMLDVLKIDAEREQRESRRNLAKSLSDTAASLPTGRKFPCIYADPPWLRKQGVTDRSYENHYSTMSWDAICAMPVADLLLDDAWVFLWIPRAHLLALHLVEMEFADDDGRVITRKVKLPLAWAVARAWGCDSYSTCFVWTKTDEAHPDDIGGGVIVRDQDELLLMFKRGRGLPKPASDEKFKSNHRERKREHSRKPDHYRDMIRTMTGGVPVLELFARVDAEHPLPPDWQAWGNQAAPIEIAVNDPASVLPDAAAGLPALQDAASAPETGIVDQPVAVASDADDAVPAAERPGIDLDAELAAQCRLPLDDAEMDLQLALTAIKDGAPVDGEIVRGLIGLGYAHATTTRILITDEGEAFLAQLIDIAPALDLPLFLPTRCSA